jgi:putative ABC transport system substrate-binding protein
MLRERQGDPMKVVSSQSSLAGKNVICFALWAMLLVPCRLADAQQTGKVYRVGFLGFPAPTANAGRNEAFRQGLRELGYVEGKNIIIEWRFAEGKIDRAASLAAELVRLKVDVIVTGGSGSTRPAHEATNMIPIVMAQDPDPVGNGFVATLARPGGNITGLSTLAPELSGKQLELLKEIVPSVTRVAVVGTSTFPTNAQALREVELAAGALKIHLHYLDIRNPEDIEPAFQEARKARANALLVLVGPVLSNQRIRIADLAVKSRLPAIYGQLEYVEAGGFMSYAVSFTDLHRRAAAYVDKILRGTKPADLPIEQPTKFELVINLKAAKQIGLTIPPNVLARADKVIK